MQFFAIDIETANEDHTSICQIGIANYLDGVLINEWVTLVNPQEPFRQRNIAIHGITKNDVKRALSITDIMPVLTETLADQICVCHSDFDKLAFAKVSARHNLPLLDVQWLDTTTVARQTWADCAKQGYSLPNLCKKIGYEYKAHDALEDAKACGRVLLAAIEETNRGLDYWLSLIGTHTPKAEWKPRAKKSVFPASISLDGNPNGSLYGQVVVFTGALALDRMEAAHKAAGCGCAVAKNVTQKTTFLVAGKQNTSLLAKGAKKSTKTKKAEKMQTKGHAIQIITEDDFLAMVNG